MNDEDAPGTELLDLRGLKCPLPALRTRKALRRLAPGRTLVVLCTDPLATLDIPNLVRETGDALVDAGPTEAGSRFEIRKAGAAARLPPQDQIPTDSVDAAHDSGASEQ